MNELIALGIIAVSMALAYLGAYPRVKSIVALRWLDFIFTLVAIATIGAVFWVSDPVFSLGIFETNWFVFALVSYAVIETPLWYFYLKAHPHQGTLAQLYGFTRSKKSETAAKNIEMVMNDTKWDRIRTSRAQRVLVVLGVLSLIAAPAVFWFEDYLKPGIGVLTIVPIFLIWWLLRISVRLVADAPDEFLDELQVQQRDRTYLHSFRILAGVCTALAVTLMIIVISMDFTQVGEVEYYRLDLTFGQVNAVVWAILGSIILVPNLVLAWRQAKGVKL